MIITRENIEARCVPVPESGCLIWVRAWSKQGYGNVKDSVTGRYTQAHREMARLTLGDVTDRVVCHKCDTPSCCNPDHLFIGTVSDNTQDMIKKGRSKCGLYNAQKTHCNAGHLLVGNNLCPRKSSHERDCRECRRVRDRRYKKILRDRLKAARNHG